MRKAISTLDVGDVVTEIGGQPMPFPYTVKRVVNIKGHGLTRLEFEHGGFTMPKLGTMVATCA